MHDRHRNLENYDSFLNGYYHFLQPFEPVLESWTAGVKDLIIHPYDQTREWLRKARRKYRYVPSVGVGDYEFQIKFRNKKLTLLKNISILSHFVDIEGISILKFVILELMESDRNLLLGLSPYLHSDWFFHDFMKYSHQTLDSFYGQQTEMMKLFKREVDLGLLNKNLNPMLSVPFWKDRRDIRIVPYSGWSKGYKDLGTLSSESYYRYNWQEDDNFIDFIYDNSIGKEEIVRNLIDLSTGFHMP